MDISKIFLFALLSCILAIAYGTRMQKAQQNDVFEMMRGEIASLQSQMNLQQETIGTLKETVGTLKGTISLNTEKIESLEHKASSTPTPYNRQTDFGCFSESITLWCFDGGVINITEAYYGQYISPCGSSECCMPNQTADCRVSVPENRPGDWAELKAVCTNRTSCQYEYQGSSIDECEENYLADYMQIYYSCGEENLAPAPTFDPLGFSAYAELPFYYYPNQTIRFTGLISNIGTMYNAYLSVFTCKYDGVYLFSISISSDDSYPTVKYCIVMDYERIATVAVDANGHFPAGSTVVIVECNADQNVWVVSCEGDTYMMGGSDRESVFSGYMLYPY